MSCGTSQSAAIGMSCWRRKNGAEEIYQSSDTNTAEDNVLDLENVMGVRLKVNTMALSIIRDSAIKSIEAIEKQWGTHDYY